jgi:hypothetical protein
MRLSNNSRSKQKPVKPVKPVAPVAPVKPTGIDIRLNLKFTTGVPVDHNIFITASDGLPTTFTFFDVITNQGTGLTTHLPLPIEPNDCNGMIFTSNGLIIGTPQVSRKMTYAVVATRNGVKSDPLIFNFETSPYSN